jgi:predicted AAA+ superfamily ATPase
MDMSAFQSTAAFVADNVGNISSIKRISDNLSAQGSKIAQGTVNEYLEALTENYLLHKVKRFDLRGKEYLKTLEKYYLGDMGIRFWLLGKKAGDLGHRLENIVYLELCRRYTNVFIGKEGEHEVDFVAMNEQGHHYFQVCQTVMDESTLARELKPLQSIKDNYPKVLLSMDTIGTGDHAGIAHLNLINWLLE